MIDPMEDRNYYISQRRIRANRHIRELAASVKLSYLDFVQPLFVDESLSDRKPIATLEGINSDTIESAIAQIHLDLEAGVSKFLLFPVPKEKKEKNFDFRFA